jgi:hypothetical protein
MNIVQLHPIRTLSQILAELMLAEAELKRLMFRENGLALTDEQDARWSQLEGTIWLRRDEAKAMIADATGVPWDAIEAASL